MVAAKNKTKNRKQLTRTIKKESAKEIGTINKRDRFMVGVSLYAGEGGKTDKDISFVNSNHKFIIFMMGWFREFCNVPLINLEEAFICMTI